MLLVDWIVRANIAILIMAQNQLSLLAQKPEHSARSRVVAHLKMELQRDAITIFVRNAPRLKTRAQRIRTTNVDLRLRAHRQHRTHAQNTHTHTQMYMMLAFRCFYLDLDASGKSK